MFETPLLEKSSRYAGDLYMCVCAA